MKVVIKLNPDTIELLKSFGIKNYSKLTRKRIVDKNGHSRIVWVKQNEDTKKMKSFTGTKSIETFNKKELVDFFINKIESEKRNESFEECKKIIDELNISKYKNIQQFLRLVKPSEFDDYVYTHKVFKKADKIDIKVNYIKKELNTINDKLRGNPMSFSQADKSSSNPDFGYLSGYGDNCAVCVAAFEARLRGFDVKAKPRIIEVGNVVDFIARNDVDIWKIQGKGKYPTFMKCEKENNLLVDMFDDIIQNNERYEIKHEIDRKVLDNTTYIQNHVLIIGKDNNGKIFIHDPQTAEIYYGKDECDEYFQIWGCNEYMRIDNLDFNENLINEVME